MFRKSVGYFIIEEIFFCRYTISRVFLNWKSSKPFITFFLWIFYFWQKCFIKRINWLWINFYLFLLKIFRRSWIWCKFWNNWNWFATLLITFKWVLYKLCIKRWFSNFFLINYSILSFVFSIVLFFTVRIFFKSIIFSQVMVNTFLHLTQLIIQKFILILLSILQANNQILFPYLRTLSSLFCLRILKRLNFNLRIIF